MLALKAGSPASRRRRSVTPGRSSISASAPGSLLASSASMRTNGPFGVQVARVEAALGQDLQQVGRDRGVDQPLEGGVADAQVEHGVAADLPVDAVRVVERDRVVPLVDRQRERARDVVPLAVVVVPHARQVGGRLRRPAWCGSAAPPSRPSPTRTSPPRRTAGRRNRPRRRPGSSARRSRRSAPGSSSSWSPPAARGAAAPRRRSGPRSAGCGAPCRRRSAGSR